MYHSDLIPGDLIRRKKGPVWHWGVCLPEGIVHNTPAHGEHISSLAEFGEDQAINIIKSPDINRMEIMNRAYAIVSNPSDYQYLWRNCEHTFSEIAYGEATSPTVKNLVGLLLVVGGAIAITKYRAQVMQVLRQIA